MKHVHALIPLFIFSFLAIFEGCGGCPYSFNGSSVPPHLKTIALPYADDKTGSGEAGLREIFTQTLVQKFNNDNSFRITDRSKADAVLDVTLVSLNEAPMVVTAGETVSGRRITLVVSVVYRDMVKKKTILEKQFNNYGDFSSGITERTNAIKTAIDKITDDILLDVVSGW
jgi:hypothetical protein